MRNLIILLLIVSFCNCAKAQLSADEKAVIQLIIQSQKPDFCSDNANFPTPLIETLKNYLKTDTTTGLFPAEEDELFKKMYSATHLPKWHRSDVNHIRFYDHITDTKYYVDTMQYDSVTKKWSNIYIYYFLQFSKPIFIRNNSICFVYEQIFQTCFASPHSNFKDCPSRGIFSMYVKNNGVWKYKTSIISWNGD